MSTHTSATSQMVYNGTYRKRPVRFLELLAMDDWTVKVYGISAHRALPPAELIERARAVARATLSSLADDVEHRVAILIVHEGRDGNYALLDWWVGGNMLCQRVYRALLESPFDLRDFSDSGISACVWELPVLAFERDAWVETILDNPSGPDLASYCARRLNADV